MGKRGGYRSLLGSPGLSLHLSMILGNASLSLQTHVYTHTHTQKSPFKMTAPGPEGQSWAGGPSGPEPGFSGSYLDLSARRGRKPPGVNRLTALSSATRTCREGALSPRLPRPLQPGPPPQEGFLMALGPAEGKGEGRAASAEGAGAAELGSQGRWGSRGASLGEKLQE